MDFEIMYSTILDLKIHQIVCCFNKNKYHNTDDQIEIL